MAYEGGSIFQGKGNQTPSDGVVDSAKSQESPESVTKNELNNQMNDHFITILRSINFIYNKMRDETLKMKEYSQLNKELEVSPYPSIISLIEY